MLLKTKSAQVLSHLKSFSDFLLEIRNFWPASNRPRGSSTAWIALISSHLHPFTQHQGQWTLLRSLNVPLPFYPGPGFQLISKPGKFCTTALLIHIFIHPSFIHILSAHTLSLPNSLPEWPSHPTISHHHYVYFMPYIRIWILLFIYCIHSSPRSLLPAS